MEDPLKTIDVVGTPVEEAPPEAKLVAELLSKKPSGGAPQIPPVPAEAPPAVPAIPEPHEISSSEEPDESSSESSPENSGRIEQLFSYWSADQTTPVELSFKDLNGDKMPKIKLVAAHKNCQEQVEQLAKVLEFRWKVKLARTKPDGEAWIYYLKHSHLQTQDTKALETLRSKSLEGKICFLFVDVTFEEMPKVIEKLRVLNRLPPHCILFPWETNISDDTLKALLGMTVSIVGQSITESRRAVNRVWLPGLRH